MSYAQSHVVTLTTNADGAATGYTPVVNGKILSIIYDKTDFADGVDFNITTEDTLQNVWVETNVDADKTVCPRQPIHSTAGVASLFAAAGEPVEDYIYAANERIKIIVDDGGNVTSGVFRVIVGG